MTKRILLCDDESHILRAAEFKFKRAGYEVACATDGEEAWQQIQRQVPDVLVTDCQMPRMSGLQLAQRVKETPLTRDLPMIMLSAKGFELSPQELHEKYGIRCLMGKPFSPRELYARVEAVLAGEATEGTTVLTSPLTTPASAII